MLGRFGHCWFGRNVGVASEDRWEKLVEQLVGELTMESVWDLNLMTLGGVERF